MFNLSCLCRTMSLSSCFLVVTVGDLWSRRTGFRPCGLRTCLCRESFVAQVRCLGYYETSTAPAYLIIGVRSSERRTASIPLLHHHYLTANPWKQTAPSNSDRQQLSQYVPETLSKLLLFHSHRNTPDASPSSFHRRGMSPSSISFLLSSSSILDVSCG